MKFLFDSKGKHIANFVNGQLHSPTGDNIGHFLESYNFFIDMSGYYLGEIVKGDRLMYNLSSSYRNTCFGCYGNYGNVGNYGTPGSRGAISVPSGYRDVNIT